MEPGVAFLSDKENSEPTRLRGWFAQGAFLCQAQCIQSSRVVSMAWLP